jgi:hypothetical protein
MLRSKRLAFALTALLGAAGAPAHADTTALVCSMSSEGQAEMVQQGYPDSAATVMHVTIDTSAQTATDWTTNPNTSFPPRPVVYPASFSGSQVRWSTPPDPDDGSRAVRELDRSTNVLNTIDPDGHSTLWNCN